MISGPAAVTATTSFTLTDGILVVVVVVLYG